MCLYVMFEIVYIFLDRIEVLTIVIIIRVAFVTLSISVSVNLSYIGCKLAIIGHVHYTYWE